MLNEEYQIPKEIEDFAEDISGGYWNTRIIKHITDDETYYAIHEVYYRKDDTIWSWSTDPIDVMFEDKNDFGEFAKHIMEAATRPILVLNKQADELEETKEIWVSPNKLKGGKNE